jgi:UDP-N-acetylmuramoyl-L-alanyl-D-glutamate--2,6-diaminopimelate ligase
MNVEISGIENDSRRVESGDLFVAVCGETVDGHDFLDSAVSRGASALLVDAEIFKGRMPQDSLITVVAMNNIKAQLSKIASHFYGHPSERFEVMGITGTNGKTSIAQMLADALESCGEEVAVFGTIGNRIGKTTYETTNTTLEPIALQRLFKTAADSGVTTLIMEVSSHGLELGRVDDTRFDGAIFTNLTEDHLDFHPDMEAYFQAKKKLFLMNHGVSIINADDAYGLRLAAELRTAGKSVLTYGMSVGRDVYASEVVWLTGATRYRLRTPDFETEVTVSGLGRIQVYNTLAVFAALYARGFTALSLITVSKQLKGVPGRMERIDGNRPYDVFVDFAHTPDALKNVLSISRELTQGRLKVVFGCGGDRDRKKRPIMGAIASELADEIFITSDNPRTENPAVILDEVVSGVQPDQHSKVQIEMDRRKAIYMAVLGLKVGDVLVIAGKGHETYQIIGREKFHFDDREIAVMALEEKDRMELEG